MKNIPGIIFFLGFFCKYILCQENLDELFRITYNKMSKLPVGSTIYYTRNMKCVSYNTTSSICLIKGSLYKIVGNNYHILLTNITGYSDSFYYELNLYNESDYNYRHCIITHFLNESKLIFKYYPININNNSIDNNTDFYNYNESLNPLNKGINCHTRDNEYRFTCFFLNKEKKVIQMEINTINGTHNTNITFKTATIKNSYVLDNNTLIMSSLYNNKFKLFSCYKCSESDYFNIYAKNNGNIDFDLNIVGPPSFVNNVEFKNFQCKNNENITLFAVFKDQNFPNMVSYTDYKGFTNINLNIFYEEKTSLRMLEKQLFGAQGGGNQGEEGVIGGSGREERELKLVNIIDTKDQKLIFEQIENIIFFQPIKKIEYFQFDKNEEKNSYIIHTNIHNEKLLSTDIHNTKENLTKSNHIIINYTETEKLEKEEKEEELKISTIKQSNIYNNIQNDNTYKIKPEKKEQIKELTLPKPNITKEEVLENIEQIINNTVIGETYEYQEEDFN